MALVSTVCPECKEKIKVDDSKAIGFCLNCGAQIDTTTIEKKPKTTRKRSATTSTQNTDIAAAQGKTISPLVQNYIQLATSAQKAGNNEQCEMYCNRIIEVDSTIAAVWALKGVASGWQSSLANVRIEEMLIYFGNAVNLADDLDEANSYRRLAKDELTKILLAIFDLQCDRFQKWTDEEESKAFEKLHLLTLTSAIQYLSNLLSDMFQVSDVLKQAAMKVDVCAVSVENVVRSEFSRSNNGYPDDYDWRRMLDKMGYCNTVYKAAAEMAKDCDYDLRITCFSNMINNHNYCIGSYSYKDDYAGDFLGWVKIRSLSLSQAAINYREGEISKCNAEIRITRQAKAQEEARIKKERIDAYWAEHVQEKENYLAEMKQLEAEVQELNSRLAAIDRMDDILGLKKKLEILQQERAAISLFKFKEKKIKDEEIVNMDNRLKSLLSERKTPVEKDIERRKKRISEINNILTRDR